MANATESQIIDALGSGGTCNFDIPVDAGSKGYKGTLTSQLTATGMAVPYSTASSGICVGVAQHDYDNSAAGASDGEKRVQVESRRMFAFDNGAGGDAFSEAHLIGSLVYGTDDHTVANNSSGATRKPVGFFYGMESDGKVRVFVDPAMARIVELLQGLTDAPATADALRDNIVGAFG